MKKTLFVILTGLIPNNSYGLEYNRETQLENILEYNEKFKLKQELNESCFIAYNIVKNSQYEIRCQSSIENSEYKILFEKDTLSLKYKILF